MYKILFYNKFIISLNMFRALLCSSSWGQIVLYSIWYHHTETSGLKLILDYSLVSVWWYQMLYNTILTSWWWAQQCSKHVKAYNKLIITKQDFVHQVGKLLILYWDARSAKHKKKSWAVDRYSNWYGGLCLLENPKFRTVKTECATWGGDLNESKRKPIADKEGKL